MKFIPLLLSAATLQCFAQLSPDALIDRIVHRIETRGDNSFNILLLSGGGEYGAYGAGFLRGWKSRASQAMPDFDMVTGVSTGALIAPYAFAGDAASLATIGDEYSAKATEIKPSFEYLFFLKRDGGLLNRKNLESTIARNYNDALFARIQPGLGAGRILLIGTTNLRTGIGNIWDLRDLAGNGGLPFLHNLLIASTAVPGAFAPVELKGDFHVDGGVASNTLLGLDLSSFRQLASRLKKNSKSQLLNIHLYVIVNKPVYPSIEAGDYRNVLTVHDRSDRLLFGLKELMTLTRYWELSEAVNASIPGLRMHFHYTAVPQSMSAKVTLRKIFDPILMKQLDQYGFDRARGDSPWDTLPLSAYQRP